MDRTIPGHRAPEEMTLADDIHSIADQLSALPAPASQFCDALAFVLSRVADADRRFTGTEARRIERALQEHARLTPAQAALVVEIGKHRRRIADAARAYRESCQLRHRLDTEERARVIDVLYEVASADGEITSCELSEILQVAAEIGFTHDDLEAFRHLDLDC